MGKKSNSVSAAETGDNPFEMLSGMGAEEATTVSLLGEVGGAHVNVEFTMPDGKTGKKDLEISHPELRRLGAKFKEDDYREGDAVKIWSNTRRAWCNGTVVSMRGGATPKASGGKSPTAGKKGSDDPFEMMAGMVDESSYNVNLLKEVGGAQLTVKFSLPDGTSATKEMPVFHQEIQKTYVAGDKVEVWSNTHNHWCPGKVLEFRPLCGDPVEAGGSVEMKVSAKHGVGFYGRAAESFLNGTPGKEAKDGKPAIDAKPSVNILKISGTGEAVGIAIGTAAKCESAGWGKISKVETAYPELSAGHGCAQIIITIHKTQ